ncbi:hypothetical protein [Microcoleus sp. B5-D4]
MPVPQELLERSISPLKRTLALSQGMNSLADSTGNELFPITHYQLLWQKD